eukprot:3754562-Alexandrium_andersonii.AAC.1
MGSHGTTQAIRSRPALRRARPRYSSSARMSAYQESGSLPDAGALAWTRPLTMTGLHHSSCAADAGCAAHQPSAWSLQ